MKIDQIYKNKIHGLREVSETVKTIEKIAASQVHVFKQRVNRQNQYIKELEYILDFLCSYGNFNKHSLFRSSSDSGKKTLVVVCSNRGLVGGLWYRLISYFIATKKDYNYCLMLGEKAARYLKEENIRVDEVIGFPKDYLQTDWIEDINNMFLDRFQKGEFSKVDILYTKFVSLADQEIMVRNFLPFAFRKYPQEVDSFGLPIFEPSASAIFNRLIRKYISIYFISLIIEAKLSEESARTVYMEQAAQQARKLMKKMTMSYLKQKRHIITKALTTFKKADRK